MSKETMAAALDFLAQIVSETRQRKVKVTFHGGEPLMAGHALWTQALEGLAARFGPGCAEVAVQSNLWELDEEFCRLFRKHKVRVGTSLDGPEEITDRQRGRGYFARTMQGVRRAQAHEIKVGCIATITPASSPRWREVFDFFLNERLGFSIHPAVLPLESQALPSPLTPRQYGVVLQQMLDYYVEHRRELAVASLDQMCHGLADGEGKVCTFRDCLGMFLAVDPNGDLFACQRFAGRSDYRLGTLADKTTFAQLLDSPSAQRFSDREETVHEACGDCRHLRYCKGGCAYNAWAGGNPGRTRDPYCRAYRQVFQHIQERLSVEMAAAGNLEAMAERPYSGSGHPLLREGALTELVRGGPHPSHVARTAKRIIGAVELARNPEIPAGATRLVQMGVCRTQETAEASLTALQKRLHPETATRNNLYLHVTFSCQLDCTHCYARADAYGRDRVEMAAPALHRLIREAKDNGFRQVVITGGEPLVHSASPEVLAMLAEARSWTAPMNLVLRTNLALTLGPETLRQIAAAVDQVVVSVDGNEQIHDARRGRGSYEAVVRNLEAYAETAAEMVQAGELSLAAVMRAVDIQGDPGGAVRDLARRLGVKRIRFRPPLPLGRAREWAEPPTPEAIGAHGQPMEAMEAGFQPVATCGLGQNLYVEPSGDAFPCYAYHQPHSYLGNVLTNGLRSVLDTEAFRDLSRHTVDTNPKCSGCDVRYLCGGVCRAWGGESTRQTLDAAPPRCGKLKRRAVDLLAAALEYAGCQPYPTPGSDKGISCSSPC